MAVLAIHKLTGKIAEVSQGLLDSNENLTLATAEDIAEAKRLKEIKVYGTELSDSGDLPAEVLGIPDSSWTKAELIAYAEHKKISVDDSFTKAEILEAILEGID